MAEQNSRLRSNYLTSGDLIDAETKLLMPNSLQNSCKIASYELVVCTLKVARSVGLSEWQMAVINVDALTPYSVWGPSLGNDGCCR